MLLPLGGTQDDTETKRRARSPRMPSVLPTIYYDDIANDDDHDHDDCPQGNSDELTSLTGEQNDENQCMTDASTETKNTKIICRPERNFNKPSAPKMSYLTNLLTVFNHWTSSNILSIQPLKGLTKPYIKFIQRCYLIVGMLQLIFMISFTVLHMPTTCSLASMFNISAASCSSSLSNISDDTAPSNVNQQRSLLALIWSIWPTLLIAGDVHATVHSIYEAYLAHKFRSNNFYRKVVRSRDLRSSFQSKLCQILLSTLSLKLFYVVMYIWIYKYVWSESYERYSEMTAMVLCFGWITNITFLEP